MKRYLVMLVALVMFASCQSQQITFSLEKDGKLYNYYEMLSFYYPRDWKLVNDELKMSLDILNEKKQEAFYFDVFDIDASNHPEQLMELYQARLKDIGVEVKNLKPSKLASGQNCFYVDGTIEKSKEAFCEVVVFMSQKQYIFSYIASLDVYEDNYELMMNYLNSLVLNEVANTAL